MNAGSAAGCENSRLRIFSLYNLNIEEEDIYTELTRKMLK